jgi:hypothetical protein
MQTTTTIDWRDHLERQEHSKLSQSEYCRRNGLKLHQFGYHRRKRPDGRRTAGVVELPLTVPRSAGPAPVFELRIDACGRIEIRINCGWSWGGAPT